MNKTLFYCLATVMSLHYVRAMEKTTKVDPFSNELKIVVDKKISKEKLEKKFELSDAFKRVDKKRDKIDWRSIYNQYPPNWDELPADQKEAFDSDDSYDSDDSDDDRSCPYFTVELPDGSFYKSPYSLSPYYLKPFFKKLLVQSTGSELHAAALGNCLELVSHLVKERKQDVNSINSEGRTPLHLAAHTSAPMIFLLTRLGAKWDIKDKGGKTPDELSQSKKHFPKLYSRRFQ